MSAGKLKITPEVINQLKQKGIFYNLTAEYFEKISESVVDSNIENATSPKIDQSKLAQKIANELVLQYLRHYNLKHTISSAKKESRNVVSPKQKESWTKRQLLFQQNSLLISQLLADHNKKFLGSQSDSLMLDEISSSANSKSGEKGKKRKIVKRKLISSSSSDASNEGKRKRVRKNIISSESDSDAAGRKRKRIVKRNDKKVLNDKKDLNDEIDEDDSYSDVQKPSTRRTRTQGKKIITKKNKKSIPPSSSDSDSESNDGHQKSDTDLSQVPPKGMKGYKGRLVAALDLIPGDSTSESELSQAAPFETNLDSWKDNKREAISELGVLCEAQGKNDTNQKIEDKNEKKGEYRDQRRNTPRPKKTTNKIHLKKNDQSMSSSDINLSQLSPIDSSKINWLKHDINSSNNGKVENPPSPLAQTRDVKIDNENKSSEEFHFSSSSSSSSESTSKKQNNNKTNTLLKQDDDKSESDLSQVPPRNMKDFLSNQHRVIDEVQNDAISSSDHSTGNSGKKKKKMVKKMKLAIPKKLVIQKSESESSSDASSTKPVSKLISNQNEKGNNKSEEDISFSSSSSSDDNKKQTLNSLNQAGNEIERSVKNLSSSAAQEEKHNYSLSNSSSDIISDSSDDSSPGPGTLDSINVPTTLNTPPNHLPDTSSYSYDSEYSDNNDNKTKSEPVSAPIDGRPHSPTRKNKFDRNDIEKKPVRNSPPKVTKNSSFSSSSSSSDDDGIEAGMTGSLLQNQSGMYSTSTLMKSEHEYDSDLSSSTTNLSQVHLKSDPEFEKLRYNSLKHANSKPENPNQFIPPQSPKQTFFNNDDNNSSADLSISVDLSKNHDNTPKKPVNSPIATRQAEKIESDSNKNDKKDVKKQEKKRPAKKKARKSKKGENSDSSSIHGVTRDVKIDDEGSSSSQLSSNEGSLVRKKHTKKVKQLDKNGNLVTASEAEINKIIGHSSDSSSRISGVDLSQISDIEYKKQSLKDLKRIKRSQFGKSFSSAKSSSSSSSSSSDDEVIPQTKPQQHQQPQKPIEKSTQKEEPKVQTREIDINENMKNAVYGDDIERDFFSGSAPLSEKEPVVAHLAPVKEEKAKKVQKSTSYSSSSSDDGASATKASSILRSELSQIDDNHGIHMQKERKKKVHQMEGDESQSTTTTSSLNSDLSQIDNNHGIRMKREKRKKVRQMDNEDDAQSSSTATTTASSTLNSDLSQIDNTHGIHMKKEKRKKVKQLDNSLGNSSTVTGSTENLSLVPAKKNLNIPQEKHKKVKEMNHALISSSGSSNLSKIPVDEISSFTENVHEAIENILIKSDLLVEQREVKVTPEITSSEQMSLHLNSELTEGEAVREVKRKVDGLLTTETTIPYVSQGLRVRAVEDDSSAVFGRLELPLNNGEMQFDSEISELDVEFDTVNGKYQKSPFIKKPYSINRTPKSYKQADFGESVTAKYRSAASSVKNASVNDSIFTFELSTSSTTQSSEDSSEMYNERDIEISDTEEEDNDVAPNKINFEIKPANSDDDGSILQQFKKNAIILSSSSDDQEDYNNKYKTTTKGGITLIMLSSSDDGEEEVKERGLASFNESIQLDNDDENETEELQQNVEYIEQQTPDFEGEMTLKVTVVEARGLKQTDIGPLDPYCFLNLKKRTHRTKTIRSATSPIWDQQFIFNFIANDTTDSSRTMLSVKIFTEDKFSGDREIAHGEINIRDLKRNTFIDEWIKLKPAPGVKKGGEVRLTLLLEPKETDILISPRKTPTTPAATFNNDDEKEIAPRTPASAYGSRFYDSSSSSTTSTIRKSSSSSSSSSSDSENENSAHIEEEEEEEEIEPAVAVLQPPQAQTPPNQQSNEYEYEEDFEEEEENAEYVEYEEEEEVNTFKINYEEDDDEDNDEKVTKKNQKIESEIEEVDFNKLNIKKTNKLDKPPKPQQKVSPSKQNGEADSSLNLATLPPLSGSEFANVSELKPIDSFEENSKFDQDDIDSSKLLNMDDDDDDVDDVDIIDHHKNDKSTKKNPKNNQKAHQNDEEEEYEFFEENDDGSYEASLDSVVVTPPANNVINGDDDSMSSKSSSSVSSVFVDELNGV
ncbi:hypothetical protein TRFO_08928 [Tritrichomonas foetus]|uniref:C2 domain-containing protein n=1 Tax=Tritrichomonas foetus TaxID=1144522 RepID=A0A1J4JI24_9EUKA|nr:hypothetical protein TRFO_08928 [Tritrichomonas foetus]|eukprot:OHS98345.1 hypothetical protein TRFO_08928 [Tritrichomonas foetus]